MPTLPLLPLLIDTETLLPHLNHPDLRLIDLGRASVYQQVHLAGAQWLNGRRLMSGHPDAVGSLPSLGYLTDLMAEFDIRPQHHVVAYDDEGGGWASRLIWTLHMLGHTRVSLLDGGIHAALADGLELHSGDSDHNKNNSKNSSQDHSDHALTQPHNAPPVWQYQAQYRAEREQVLSAIDTNHSTLWDCRSWEEYTGERLAARRGGHLPQAKHYEWTQAINRDNAMRLHPLAQIRQELQERGIMGTQPIITYCQSHHRSAFSYVLGRILGFDIAAYDGGFHEWGNRSDTPLHTGEQP